MRAEDLDREIRALPSAPEHPCFSLTEDLHGCRLVGGQTLEMTCQVPTPGQHQGHDGMAFGQGGTGRLAVRFRPLHPKQELSCLTSIFPDVSAAVSGEPG